MAVQDYSTTAASNNAAPPNGAPEGMTPGSVNDTIRQIMADVALESQVNRVKYLNSVAGTNTIAASMTPSLAAYSAGMIVVFNPANTNSGATTLNINSLGALDVFKQNGVALASGDLVAGTPAVLVLDSGADDWILLNPMSLSTLNVSSSLTYGGVEVGFRGFGNRRNVSAVGNTIAADAGGLVVFTASGFLFTLDTDVPGDSIVTLINAGSGSVTISATALEWYNGTGTIGTGTRTLANAGVCTVWRTSAVAANFAIWGTGLS